MPFPEKPYRRLRMEGAVDGELLRKTRARTRFIRKMGDALTEEGIRNLAYTKSMHDKMEALYHPYIDFERVNRMADLIVEDIFSA